MGLGILVESDLPKQGWLGRRVSRDTLLAQVRSAIMSFLTDPLQERLVSFHAYEHSLSVNLHPAAALEFVWSPTHLRASIKTSAAGPGLHAFACDILKQVEQACGLTWVRKDADETGYLVSADFSRLQHEMARFLRALGKEILRLAGDRCTNLTLDWPLGQPHPNCSAFTVSPFGVWSEEWWTRLVGSDGPALLSQAEEFYPWWHQARDARYWKNTGLLLLLNDVPWHIPVGEDEARTCRLTLDCFGHARSLDPSVLLPEAEIEELSQFLAESKDEPPRQEGLGFRRYAMRYDVWDSWTLILPGYFYRDTEDEGTTLVLWYGDRTVRVSTMSVSGDKPASPDALLPETPGTSEMAFRMAEHLKGIATIESAEEDGEKLRTLFGRVATHNSLCLVSISYRDPNDDGWAVETFKSVSHPPVCNDEDGHS